MLPLLYSIFLVVVHLLVGVQEGNVPPGGRACAGLGHRLMNLEETFQQVLPTGELTFVRLLLTYRGALYLWWLGQQHVGNLDKK